MTPKEKAKELTDKMFLKIPSVYDPTNLPHYPIAKEMALIAVDLLLEEMFFEDEPIYWEQVKKEIENL